MSATVNLVKDQKIDLTKSNPGLTKVKVGLGWNPSTVQGKTYDIDASCFILGADGKKLSTNHFIFYNNIDGSGTTSPEFKAGKQPNPIFGVLHSGDERTGAAAGDDESITVDFSKLPADATEIVFVVTTHETDAQGNPLPIDKRTISFGQVSDCYIRVVDETNNAELMRFDLQEDNSANYAMIFGKLYKKDNEWKFQAVGTGGKLGLQEYLNQF